MGLSIVTEIRGYIDTLDGLNFQDSGAVHDAGIKLEELLLPVEANRSELPMGAFDSTSMARVQGLYEQFETNLEISFANNFLQGGVQLEEYNLYKRFQRLINSEVELASIKSSDRVLFIGSGPLPISAILIAQKTGAHVDCFDHSSEACDTSRSVIDKLGLADRIRVVHQSAECVELPTINSAGTYGTYDVVVVALLAQPKNLILHQLWMSLGPDPRVVLRYSEGNRQLIYKGMELSAATWNNRYSLGEHHSAGVDDTISTLVARTSAQPRIFKL